MKRAVLSVLLLFLPAIALGQDTGPSCSFSLDFRCANGQCTSSSNRCDSFNDCLDGSDEAGCFYVSWSAGSYAGLSVALGIFVFVCIVAAISRVVYMRRRVVLVRPPVDIAPNLAVVTQTRW